VPAQLKFENLEGLCFVGSTGQTRDSNCNAADTAVGYVKITLVDQPNPYVIVFDPLTGLGRLVDCTKPKAERPESVVGNVDRCT
jgi:uracil-DNA glycosylase